MDLGRNSPGACLWLLMLELDADGARKDMEFDELQNCLNELYPELANDPGGDAQILALHLSNYYRTIEEQGQQMVFDTAVGRIDDPDLQQKILSMLARIAISDSHLHPREDTLIRQIAQHWGMEAHLN